MTAAHRTLKFGTRIKVTNLQNGRSVQLCVNDRGPYSGGRLVDVTRAAAQQLGFVKSGWTRVRLDVVGRQRKHCRG
jgi:rare lipoprotein A